MSILKVARMGHPVLRRIAEPVAPEEIGSPELKRLVADMYETMAEYNGIGLAAPQVHVSKRLALVGGDFDDDDQPLVRVVINPEITTLTDVPMGMYEGCLSVPGMRGWVERPVEIHVAYLDENGERVEQDLEGFHAVVFQHECDHLQGKLFVDRIKDLRRLAYEDEAERFMKVDSIIDGRDV